MVREHRDTFEPVLEPTRAPGVATGRAYVPPAVVWEERYLPLAQAGSPIELPACDGVPGPWCVD
jgi:hypothetical protein